MVKTNNDERKFLEQYDITQFERPSIAADIAVFSIRSNESENYRKLPNKKLDLLLIKRGSYPFIDQWALPGGFCKSEETVEETARRELYEETNVEYAYLELADIFSEKERDPRGWIMSNAFLALMDGEKCKLRAGSDAWEARWFSVELNKLTENRQYEKERVTTKLTYELKLVNKDVNLVANILEKRIFENDHVSKEYEILQSEGFAFDHAKIIMRVLKKLQEKAKYDGRIVFDLMPEYFTLTQLQQAFEVILNEELIPANFRRKISDYVKETNHISEGAGHRPAKLFKRNLEAFYNK